MVESGEISASAPSTTQVTDSSQPQDVGPLLLLLLLSLWFLPQASTATFLSSVTETDPRNDALGFRGQWSCSLGTPEASLTKRHEQWIVAVPPPILPLKHIR